MISRIQKITHGYADIFIASDNRDNQTAVDYSYGGTRTVRADMEELEVRQVATRLMRDESALKNTLINLALSQGALKNGTDRIPQGFLDSRVGGARCVIRPKTQELATILANPQHPDFEAIVSPIFETIGKSLNEQQGKIKLTPDFGRFAGLADRLYQFTPHSLGIRCEVGGCGGKSSYSSTGIISAIETLGLHQHKDIPVTLIGSAGAMGSEVLTYVLKTGFTNVAVCDLAYDNPAAPIALPPSLQTLPSKPKAFTISCLKRGGVIIATTFGQELENSYWQAMPPGTILLLAHNLAIPTSETGINLMQEIEANGVFALPGQVLTLGGALTSRLEWFWRQAKSGMPFDKPLAHLIVRDVVKFLVSEIQALSTSLELTPYEAMLHYAQHPSQEIAVLEVA